MLRRALRRVGLPSAYGAFSVAADDAAAAAVVDGRCFLNGFDISKKSSSDCVTDKSDKNDPVELISLQYLSSYRFVLDFRLRVDISKNANLFRVSSLMSRLVCKKSHARDNFFSWKNDFELFFCELRAISVRIDECPLFGLPNDRVPFRRHVVLCSLSLVDDGRETISFQNPNAAVHICQAHAGAFALRPLWLAIANGFLQ